MRPKHIDSSSLVTIVMLIRSAAAAIFGSGCTTVVLDEHDRVVSATDCDTVFIDPPMPDMGAGGSTSSTGGTLTCPTIANGDVTFSIAGYPDRVVNFSNVGGASGSGALLLYWHGTYEGASSPLTNALPYGFLSAAQNDGALVAMPRADVEATSRTNNPFPWWTVCGQTNPAQCDRDDDFALAETVAACAVDQGLASPDRLTSSGMSAGGIMTSRLIERGIGTHVLAAAVSWSGGEPLAQQPTVPDDARTAVFVLHGGSTDVYCGVGNPAGTCSGYEPYSFVQPSEQLASDVDDGVNDADGFAFVCDHGSGHNAVMGAQGVEFLLVSNLAAAHPWAAFPSFGAGGNPTGWPSMSGGAEWMLRNYGDCHNAM